MGTAEGTSTNSKDVIAEMKISSRMVVRSTQAVLVSTQKCGCLPLQSLLFIYKKKICTYQNTRTRTVKYIFH